MSSKTEPTLQEQLKRILAIFTTRIYLEGGNNADEITEEALTSIINLVDKEVGENETVLDADPRHPKNIKINARNKFRNDMRAKLKGVSNG